jgi:NADH-quinone oxidoreductase subunit J
MSLDWALFTLVAAGVVASALGVVLSQSIIRSAVWLLFTLVGVSLVYFLLGAAFLGATQLIIYVGGTLVLIVFGAMLTGGGPFAALRSRPLEWVAGGTVAVALFAGLATVSFRLAVPAYETSGEGATTGQLGLAFLGIRDRESRGGAAYLLPFEIVSVHLLVVLVGAAYLARAKKRQAPRGLPTS